MSDTTTSQRDTEASLRETRTTDTDSEEKKSTDSENEEGLSEAALRSREADKYRRKLRDLESANADLQAKFEELENSKLSAEDKIAKDREKLQRQIDEAKREAQDANRKLLSSKAVLKHSLPEALSEMLQGKDEDEIDDHAKSLAAELDKWARGKYKPVAPDLEGGNRGGSALPGVLDEKTKAAKVRETAAAF